MNNNRKDESLNTDDSEFKLFRQIEDTISGVFDFVERFIATSVALTIRPSKVLIALQKSGATRYSRPYTYLAVSVFLSGVFLRGARNRMYSMFRQSFEDTPVPPTMLQEFQGLTITGLFERIFPTLISVILIGIIFGLAIKDRQRIALRCISYAGGFLFVLLSLWSFANYIYENAGGAYGLVEILLGIASYMAFLYIILGPAYILYTFIRTPLEDSRLEVVPKKVKAMGASFVISVAMLFTGIAGALVHNYFPNIEDIDKITFHAIDTKLKSDGRIEIVLTVRNKGDGLRDGLAGRSLIY